MGSQQRRFGKRKVLGTAVVAGVLAAAGVAGVQLSYAGESADGVVVINGQEFDAAQVAECAVLQINGAQVLCDDVELDAVDLADAEQLQLQIDALEAACDVLVAEVDGQNINNAADVKSVIDGVNVDELEELAEEELAEENVGRADQELENLINTCLALGRAKVADLDAAEAIAEQEAAEAEELAELEAEELAEQEAEDAEAEKAEAEEADAEKAAEEEAAEEAVEE